MSKSKYILRDFIATVPSCVQTAALAAVLELFSQSQSDRLVMLNQQQSPIGVVRWRRFMPQVIQLSKDRSESLSLPYLDIQQPFWEMAVHIVEPVVTLSADLNLEQFKSYLHSQQDVINTDCEWALIDSDGQFLGLLESNRLWKFLALSPTAGQEIEHTPSPAEISKFNYGMEPDKLDLLVQLLEKLPLPLMLQTTKGEVITQNPAWCQQLGALSDPEALRNQVEAILNTAFATATEGSKGEMQLNSVQSDLLVNQPRQESEVVGVDLSQLTLRQSLQESKRLKQHSDYALNAAEVEVAEENESSGFMHCQQGNQPGTCVCVWSKQNGQERVWQFLKVPLLMSVVSNQLENEQIWLLMATEVTEQQQMASELAAKNADLIQLNRLKDEFLACISHELRTPLTAVLGLSTLLKDQTLGQLNDRQARYAKLIHENGRHLMSVVNDILDLTRMETGQLELTPEPVQIRKVCDRAIEQARAAIQPKTSQSTTKEADNTNKHRFTLSIEAGLETIVADELRLRQMLVHLLANGFKFTQSGGEIGLRVSYWAGWIAFTVWDTGIGIPEHQQHLIFQKFQQLESPLTRQFEGTGLGLVLTRALARLHGGDVSFLSQEGKGSQFSLLLPPSPPQKRAGEPRSRGNRGDEGNGGISSLTSLSSSSFSSTLAHPSLENRRNHLVLLVEAAPRFIEDLAEQLTSLGYWVAIARSGTEALEKARRLQPGAIFLNPLLPLLSGWDLLTLLKSDAATSQIPVIVTTTRAEKDQALSHRADEFLSLPVKQKVLQQVITHFCGSPSISRPSKDFSVRTSSNNQLTVLRLLTSHSAMRGTPAQDWLPLNCDSSLLQCRILEADDLEQAELLARIWQPDVVLLDGAILDPLSYLQHLVQRPSLAALPIVTLDAATTQAANQVNGLSVFPYLAKTSKPSTNGLLSVLQIAAGRSCEYSVLVVDIATLLEQQKLGEDGSEKVSPIPNSHSSLSLRCEWLQALIQYLHTAGFRGVMAHSWEEVQQQIQQQSVDLLLICLGESQLALHIQTALTQLEQHQLPPVIVMDRRFSQREVREQFPHYLEADEQELSLAQHSYTGGVIDRTCIQADDTVKPTPTPGLATVESVQDKLDSLDTVVKAIATKVLPSSVSMEELLENIHQALLAAPARK